MGIFSQKIEPTSITVNIDRATDPRQQEEDWDLIMQIIEVVGRTETGPKEARKLLQQKLKSRNPHVQLLSLGIIKALADNCGSKFHIQLVAKSFLEDLQNLFADHTTDPEVQKRILEYLSIWANADEFKKNEALKPIRTLYTNLRENRRSVVRRENTGKVPLSPLSEAEKKQQILDDIELARNSAHMLSQAVTFADPEKEDVKKNTLIEEFNAKCRDMSKVIFGYLSKDSIDPQFLNPLIEVNQELLNAFKAYDDLMEQSNVANATKVSEKINYRGTGGGVEDRDQLVDFTANESSSNGPTIYPSSSTSYNNSSNPFDPFGDENEVSDDVFAPLKPTEAGNGKGKQREREAII